MTVAAEDVEGLMAATSLTNPGKTLYPEQGITKHDLALYLASVARWMLPHIANRPVTLVRCPAGRAKKCFYQRHAGAGVNGALREAPIKGFEESGAYLYLTEARELVGLAQMGVLEVHPWGARIDRPDRPDRVIFDLDPGEGLQFTDVIASAVEVRDALARLGLVSFCKTTGGKGLHVVAPFERRATWTQAKRFAKSLADTMAAAQPRKYLTRMSKAEREGRILIDYLRNDPTSTAVAPYSPRARAGAPVAMPLDWGEVKRGLDPARFTVKSVPSLLAGRCDPWADVSKVRQRLPAVSA
ncbi:MAG: non-homologous end-joining DNA ligase [Beijerinckiaceae bacterium]|nr:non-homologous end-joining DNA ligase [Beijerinckiaceae bacterium]